MDRAGESPGRDRPRGGSSKGAEDTEGRHFRDRKRMEGERSRMRWQIETDRVVIFARDFVWLQPVIQTHDFFREDVEIPLMDGSHQGVTASPRSLRDLSDLPTHELSSRP